MKITHVTVGYSEKKSVNFKSCGIDVSLTASLTEGEDPDEVKLKLEEKCVAAVKEAYRRYSARMADELIAKAEGRDT
jgi:hypothetical protein